MQTNEKVKDEDLYDYDVYRKTGISDNEIANMLRDENAIDGNSDEDYVVGNRINYNVVYNKVSRYAPGMVPFVEYVRNIHPPRFRETKTLLEQYQKGDTSVHQRLIEMHYRYALKFAVWAYETWGYDLEDIIQECLVALLKAIDKYNIASNVAFHSFLNLCFRSAFDHKINIGSGLFRLHGQIQAYTGLDISTRAYFLKARELWFNHVRIEQCERCRHHEYCIDLLIRFVEEILEIPRYFWLSNEKRKNLIYALFHAAIGYTHITYEEVELKEKEEIELKEDSYNVGTGVQEQELLFNRYDPEIVRTNLMSVLHEVLTVQEMQVICMYFGIETGVRMDCKEIASCLSITTTQARGDRTLPEFRVRELHYEAFLKLRRAKVKSKLRVACFPYDFLDHDSKVFYERLAYRNYLKAKMLIARIVSTSRTGVDRGALEAALEMDFPYGGLIPDVSNVSVLEKFDKLDLTPRRGYWFCTKWNVTHSDATLIIARKKLKDGSWSEELEGGTLLTENFAINLNKPHLVIFSQDVEKVVGWLDMLAAEKRQGIVLNVSGPHESESPGIQESTHRFMIQLINRAREHDWQNSRWTQ